ncbi:MAG: glycoside hydrolase family 2 TIM barrel-domain containing protein [Acholeplasmataceae bacterium]|jgi:beta-galactosidase|nr:glycoside hydrolase family 2 TIM barrel-domain containing protein [Acholeplasmataceae bacterium]
MKKVDFSSAWHFKKGMVDLKHIDLSTFENMDIPHTWNNLDGEDGNDDFERLSCTYFKIFDFNHTNQHVYIEFEGSNSVTTVYLNGQLLGKHEGGYSKFRYDMTPYIKNKHNELIVYVDNKHYDDIYPLTADFTFFGGIYRKVYLIYSNPISFDLNHYGTEGVYVTQKEITHEFADIQIDAYVNGLFKDKSKIKVVSVIKDKSNKVIDEVHSIHEPSSKLHIKQSLSVSKPHLWQGIHDPYLYTVEVKLLIDDICVDERIIPTGLRFFHVDHETFYLNGKKYKLYGVCRHQDRKHLGNALTDEMHIEDINLIKEIGANSIRLAHYQQADLIYELCDKLGFIVWAEIPYISRTSTTDLKGTNALLQMEELIKQNYNHSSICMWGIGNEITLRGERVSSNEIYDQLNQLTKSIDSTRLSTIAQLANVSYDDYHNQITDLIGYNLYYGWYVGKAEDLSEWLNNYRKALPNKPLCISEYGAEGIINIHSENPKPWDYSEEYHAWYHETSYQIIEKTPFIWGSYVWNMFTFASDSRAEGNTKGINNKGLVSHDRKIKKDAFYYYQAKWTHDPMLHLNSKRFTKRYQDEIEVKAYSNQTYVDFYLNHEYIGRVESENCIFKIEVKLIEGKNHIQVITHGLQDETTFEYIEEKA